MEGMYAEVDDIEPGEKEEEAKITQINEDLVKERRKCSFNIQELTYFIDRGEENTRKRKSVEELVLSVEEFKDEIPEDYMSHKEKYENAIRKGCLLYDCVLKIFGGHLHEIALTPSNIYKVTEGVLPNMDPFILHYGLFMPTIIRQGTDEQRAQWVETDYRIIGTYAQTELGHGSFLRGLETTATFDPDTDEFILNSPTTTSYKFWPGCLGQTANTCIVVAQLIIRGTCHGIHLFVVQIRDYDTHEPLPGIKVGEIGPILGSATANNGFLGLNKVRIPRKDMLMRNAQVSRDGSYKRARHDKLTYGSMMLARVLLLTDLSFKVSAAATISVRYSAVRHQSKLKQSEPEPQILDYRTQQHKLFIAVASSHAHRVVGWWMWEFYSSVMNEIAENNLDRFGELHAISCCLKAVISRESTSIIDECRLACGGHGFLMSSNLPSLYSTAAATITYEGEYTVLLLQTGRFLLKMYHDMINGKPVPESIGFLKDYFNKQYKPWRNSPEGIIDGMNSVTAGKVKIAAESVQKHLAMGKEMEDAWNASSVLLCNASEAYARSLLCSVYWNETQKKIGTVSKELAIVLQQLSELYLVYWVLKKCGDFLLYSTMSKEDVETLSFRYEELLGLIRPNAVGLVDAFDIPDEILRSTLGAYDGRAYERLMEHAAKSPLNAETVNESFHKYIKPLRIKNKL